MATGLCHDKTYVWQYINKTEATQHARYKCIRNAWTEPALETSYQRPWEHIPICWVPFDDITLVDNQDSLKRSFHIYYCYNKQVVTNQPDIVVVNKLQKKAAVIDVAIPSDSKKEPGKLEKYHVTTYKPVKDRVSNTSCYHGMFWQEALGCGFHVDIDTFYSPEHSNRLSFRIEFNILLLMYKALNDQAPSYLKDLIVRYLDIFR